MARTKRPPRNPDRRARTEAYAEQVRLHFSRAVSEVLKCISKNPQLQTGQMYSFDTAPPPVRKKIEETFLALHAATHTAIVQGIRAEWEAANRAADDICTRNLGRDIIGDPRFAAYLSRNTEAMNAFIARSESGLNLSDRVWKHVRQLRDEMEVAITISTGEGVAAGTLSRRVRQYLNDPELMFRRFRYKDEEGEWCRRWKKRERDPEGRVYWVNYDRGDYATGRGVYKSAYKNAMRVARTETNMAFRNADHERMGQLDFVIGQRVKMSRSHPRPDICDTLQGDYPKEFRFEGWHPQCFCYVSSILAPSEQIKANARAIMEGREYTPPQQLQEYPEAFKNWVSENDLKVQNALDNPAEAPYFIRHNAGIFQEQLKRAAEGGESDT